LMVPNKHLETPHYKLERLRHDDPRLDDQKASYVMAEEAARELEADTIVSRKDADVKARPEAAVKGITPNQPAPVSQPRPQREAPKKAESSGGLFGFIKKLFSSTEPEVKPEENRNRGRNPNQRNANGNSGNNRNRGRRGDRNDRNGERTERPAADAASGEQKTRPEGQGQGRNRNNRNQNGPKPERQQNNANAATPATTGEATPQADVTQNADGEERRGRGRNRRGRGRGQRERGERSDAENTQGNDVAASTASTTLVPAPAFSGPPVGMAGSSASMPTQNLAQSFGNHKPAPAAPERSQRSHSSPKASPTPAIEVIARPAAELPKVAFKALEESPLQNVVQSAGMVWVATDSSKHTEVQSQIQAEHISVNLGRAPKAPATLPDGPMVLVETGGQEKTV